MRRVQEREDREVEELRSSPHGEGVDNLKDDRNARFELVERRCEGRRSRGYGVVDALR